MGRRKSRSSKKTTTEVNIDNLVAMAVSTGKTKMGIRTALKESMKGKPSAFVVAENCPSDIKMSLQHNAKFSGVPVIIYPKSSVELGYAIGRPHRVAVITVYDAGSSKLIDAMSKGEVSTSSEESE